MKHSAVQRVDKYLANRGLSPRRSSRKFLRENELLVNGTRVTNPDLKIDLEKDAIMINGETLEESVFVYYMLHKPKNVISTTDDELGREDVTTLIPTDRAIYPIGRLDKDTTGLIILTDDGELTHQLTHPKYHVPKVYELTVDADIDEEKLEILRNGVPLNDGMTLPAIVSKKGKVGEKVIYEMIIREGRNRQIRRMCLVVGIHLNELHRVTFGPVELGELAVGTYRALSPEEVGLLKAAVKRP